MSRKVVTGYQYPYPAEPKTWNDEERLYGRGLRRLFDTLFSRKVQIQHLADGFGKDLDISDNASIRDKLMPVGITIITETVPDWGEWEQTTVDTMTAWTRTA